MTSNLIMPGSLPAVPKVLVLGKGGREHAIIRKLRQQRGDGISLFCAPGNGGIWRHAQCMDSNPETADGIEQLADYAAGNRIDLTVVGPEKPLCAGMADLFLERGLRLFGHTAKASEIEGSKVFCTDLLGEHGIPIPNSYVANSPQEARDYVQRSCRFPVVIKADGLCAGKGVIICRNAREADDAIDWIMVKRPWGDAGNAVVIQEFLEGRECSITVVVDGYGDYVWLPESQDYKRVGDGDTGKNTGGMGAFSGIRLESKARRFIRERIIEPTIRAMQEEGCPPCGVLYFGLMLTRRGPRVLEINARFGDPELPVILARLNSDLLELLWRTTTGELDGYRIEVSPRQAVCVVAAVPSYPDAGDKGTTIPGLAEAEAAGETGNQWFLHAGTSRSENGQYVTAGGRIVYAVGCDRTRQAARGRAYGLLGRLGTNALRWRSDIAATPKTA